MATALDPGRVPDRSITTRNTAGDGVHRFDPFNFPTALTSGTSPTGRTSIPNLIPTAIAARRRAIAGSRTDFCFTANSAHGTVSKIAAATLATPLTIPIGSSVTRVAIQPLPSAAGFTERLELLIAGAPTTSFGAGNAGGTAPEQLREKVAGDLADLLEVVGEASSPLFVEIRADQLIEDAERFISEPSLQQRVILDAEAIKTFYQFEFEQQQ